MHTFILVLTLFGNTTQSGKSIGFQEFSSRHACEAAQIEWQSQAKAANAGGFAAFCVKK